jgi:hypothetical protein
MRAVRNAVFVGLVLFLAAIWHVNGRAFSVFSSFEGAYNCQSTTVWEFDGVATNWCDCNGEPDFCDPYDNPDFFDQFCHDWEGTCDAYCGTVGGYLGYARCEPLGYVECGCDGLSR